LESAELDEFLHVLGSRRDVHSLGLRNGRVSAAGLAALQNQPLTSVCLVNCPVTAELLTRLSQLPKLELLHLEHCQLPATGIGPLADCPHLETLSFIGANEQELVGLERLRSLKSLALLDSQATDEMLQAIGSFRKLTRLGVYSPCITDAGIASIRQLGELETVALSGKQLTAAILPILEQLPKLQFLYLSKMAISYQDLRAFRARKPSLKLVADDMLPTDGNEKQTAEPTDR